MGGEGLALRRFGSAATFRDRAEPFLVAHEAANNLPLGITAGLIVTPAHYAPAPYLATVERDGAVVAVAMMTPPYNLALSTTDDLAALDLIARDVHAAHGSLPGVAGPVPVAQAFVEHWRRLTGQEAERSRALRIYALETVIPVAGVPGSLRRATAADRDLLVAWTHAFTLEALGQADEARTEHAVDGRLEGTSSGFFLWEDGEPVSMVGYSGPTPHGIRVAPVYTPPARRNRGYASAAVAAASQRLLDEGRRSCFLFTDLANPTANRIYQAIGYRPVCEVDELRFRP